MTMTIATHLALSVCLLTALPLAAQAPAANPDPAQERALLDAAAEGNAAKVKGLLEKGVSARARDAQTERTALHAAAENGHLQVVELLLVHRADIQAVDRERGETPIAAAARNGHAPVVRALLARGAGPTAVASIVLGSVQEDSPEVLGVALASGKLDAEDLSLAFELAQRLGARKALAVLEKAGATPVAPHAIAPSILQRYVGRYVDATGATALTFSVEHGVLEVTGVAGDKPVRLAALAVRSFTTAAGPTVFRVRFPVDPTGGGSATVRLIGSETTYRRAANGDSR
jgi:ankyrin repeat protein